MEQGNLLSMKIVVDKNSSKHVKACTMHALWENISKNIVDIIFSTFLPRLFNLDLDFLTSTSTSKP